MALRVGGLFGQLRPSGARGLFGSGRGRAGQTILRGRSKRAYSFEIYAPDAASSVGDVGAVYCYARTVIAESPAAAAKDATGKGLQIGYIGRTDNISRQVGEHERLEHFTGHAFDAVLVLRVEQEPIRVDIARDLIELHNPVLNDLLRSYQGAGSEIS